MADVRVGPAGTRLAVLGSPIAHSKSPLLHTAAYRALGLDWSYERIEVREHELAGFLAERGPEWRGLSLTMPLKDAAFALAADVDRIATATGAVNTLFLGDGVPLGFNTDVTGLVNALAEAGVHRADRVIVLGGGATARSAIVAAAELGAGGVHVVVRRPERAAALQPVAASVGLTLTSGTFDSLAGQPDADLVLSTLPAGTVLEAAPPAELMRAAVLFDVAYEPWPSALAVAWERAGGRAVSGIGMLLHQALVQVRIFVSGDPFQALPDEPAVLAAMRDAIA